MQKRSKKIYKKMEKKIKRYNFTKSNREKFNIDIAILKKFIILILGSPILFSSTAQYNKHVLHRNICFVVCAFCILDAIN